MTLQIIVSLVKVLHLVNGDLTSVMDILIGGLKDAKNGIND